MVRTVNVPTAANPPTSTSIGRFVWPQQSTQTVKLNGSDRNLPMLMMPENWTAIDGRQVYETLTHEIGHTLQLPGLYLYSWMNQGNAQRQLGDWDLMCNDGGLPQLGLPARMALAAGSVLRADGTPADHGGVLMTAFREGDDPANQRTALGDVRNDGRFFVFMEGLEPGMIVNLHYLGGLRRSRPRTPAWGMLSVRLVRLGAWSRTAGTRWWRG